MHSTPDIFSARKGMLFQLNNLSFKSVPPLHQCSNGEVDYILEVFAVSGDLKLY